MKMIRFAAALLITIAATAAHAQQNNFDIKTQGTVTGNCHYTFDSAKGGFKVSSHFINHVPPEFAEADPVTGKAPTVTTDVQGSTSYKLDANYNYAGGSVANSNNQLSVSYTINKQRTQLQVSKMLAGAFTGDPSPPIDAKPGFVLLPDLDASAFQSFLYLATTHPTADNNYFLVLPPANASAQNATPDYLTVSWTAKPDATGTLDGKAVTLKHYNFGYGADKMEIPGRPMMSMATPPTP